MVHNASIHNAVASDGSAVVRTSGRSVSDPLLPRRAGGPTASTTACSVNAAARTAQPLPPRHQSQRADGRQHGQVRTTQRPSPTQRGLSVKQRHSPGWVVRCVEQGHRAVRATSLHDREPVHRTAAGSGGEEEGRRSHPPQPLHPSAAPSIRAQLTSLCVHVPSPQSTPAAPSPSVWPEWVKLRKSLITSPPTYCVPSAAAHRPLPLSSHTLWSGAGCVQDSEWDVGGAVGGGLWSSAAFAGASG